MGLEEDRNSSFSVQWTAGYLIRTSRALQLWKHITRVTFYMFREQITSNVTLKKKKSYRFFSSFLFLKERCKFWKSKWNVKWTKLLLCQEKREKRGEIVKKIGNKIFMKLVKWNAVQTSKKENTSMFLGPIPQNIIYFLK